VDDYPITLIFTGSSFGGVSACNQYGGRFSLAGGALSIGEIAGTAMGCAPDVAAAESAYLAALRRMSGLRVEGAELVLDGPDVELRFTRLPDAPTTELVDTTWTLESLFVNDAANAPLGEPATLELSSDGTFSGSTGCPRSAASGSSRATGSWLHRCRWTRHRANRAFKRRIHTW
jgi:heat shock protein HslJ